jgi:hypothetical protein
MLPQLKKLLDKKKVWGSGRGSREGRRVTW